MTIGELRALVNCVEPKHDNEEILCFIEKDGFGESAHGLAFDITAFTGGQLKYCISMCAAKKDFDEHDYDGHWGDEIILED